MMKTPRMIVVLGVFSICFNGLVRLRPLSVVVLPPCGKKVFIGYPAQIINKERNFVENPTVSCTETAGF